MHADWVSAAPPGPGIAGSGGDIEPLHLLSRVGRFMRKPKTGFRQRGLFENRHIDASGRPFPAEAFNQHPRSGVGNRAGCKSGRLARSSLRIAAQDTMKAKMATGERSVVFGPRLLHEIRMPVLYRGRLVGAVPARRRRLDSCQRNRR